MTDPAVSVTRCARPGVPVPGHRAPVVPARRGRPLLAGRAPARIGPWPGPGVKPGLVRGGLDGAGGVEAGCLRSRAAGQPAPLAGIRVGCHCPGNGAGAHEVTARGHPAPGPAGPFSSGKAGRVPDRSAAQLVGGAFPLLSFPFPGPAAPGCGRTPAWRGPDLTRRPERSVCRRGPTDGPPPGTQTAPGRPPPPRPMNPVPRATRC